MSQDPHDQLLLQIRGAVAEYERSLIAERMRRGRLQKYQAGGLLPWTHPPYGFRVDPTHPRDPAGVRLEPAEVAVVTDLFARYLEEGASLKAVTKQLIALQIPTPSGRCGGIKPPSVASSPIPSTLEPFIWDAAVRLRPTSATRRCCRLVETRVDTHKPLRMNGWRLDTFRRW